MERPNEMRKTKIAILVLFAYLLLDQQLTAKEWVGGVLVMTGILVSEYRRIKAASVASR